MAPDVLLAPLHFAKEANAMIVFLLMSFVCNPVCPLFYTFCAPLCWTGFGLSANIVKECVLLAIILHVTVGLKPTWDMKLKLVGSSGLSVPNLAVTSLVRMTFMIMHRDLRQPHLLGAPPHGLLPGRAGHLHEHGLGLRLPCQLPILRPALTIGNNQGKDGVEYGEIHHIYFPPSYLRPAIPPNKVAVKCGAPRVTGGSMHAVSAVDAGVLALILALVRFSCACSSTHVLPLFSVHAR